MDDLGLSVEQLATKADVSRNELYYALDARKLIPWTPGEFIRLADALSCSIDYLCGREERRIITAEEVGRVWGDFAAPYVYLWNHQIFRRDLTKLVNACHASPAEPERDLTEAEAREIHDSQTHGESRWEHLTANARIRRLDIINAARRYRPPSRAEKMQAAIDLLGPDHPEAVAVLEAARADR
jgi:hypothetical protein